VPIARLPATRRKPSQRAELPPITHRNLLTTERSLCLFDVTDLPPENGPGEVWNANQ
jgi:hypothetical protein